MKYVEILLLFLAALTVFIVVSLAWDAATKKVPPLPRTGEINLIEPE